MKVMSAAQTWFGRSTHVAQQIRKYRVGRSFLRGRFLGQRATEHRAQRGINKCLHDFLHWAKRSRATQAFFGCGEGML
jgi:hypothetical protein